MHASIIGAGAAGIFAAIQAKEKNPAATVTVLERTDHPLAKVLVSGGGRCNLTNACYEPKLLAQNYPRGCKELIGPFHTFGPQELISWFEVRGVALKTEMNGRVFPVSNRSETIKKCLLSEAQKLGVSILFGQQIHAISHEKSAFCITTQEATLSSDALLLATGSSHSGYEYAKKLGHTIIPPIPSLFSFHVPRFTLSPFSGVTVDPVSIRIVDTPFVQTGSLLITHEGFSGPPILKLSAWAARYMHEQNYRVTLSINWLPIISVDEIFSTLSRCKKVTPQKKLCTDNPFSIPQTLWRALVDSDLRLQDCSLPSLRTLAVKLHDDRYAVNGKSPNAQEFVTCGGVCTAEINWKTMESKRCPRLYFAGEILDIDGVTGGFNLQNAWTTGYIAGTSL